MADKGNNYVAQSTGWQGVDFSVAPHLLNKGKLPSARNIYTRYGLILTRKGWQKRTELHARQLLNSPLITGLIRFDHADAGGTGEGKNLITGEIVDAVGEDNTTGEPGDNYDEGDSTEVTSMPDFPASDLFPDGDGGGGAGFGSSDSDEGSKQTEEESEDEKTDDEIKDPESGWLLEVWAPTDIYWWCPFDLTVEAKEGSGTYDGTGADLKYAVFKMGRNQEPTLLTTGDAAIDITSGWSDNSWTETIVPEGDPIPNLPGRLAFRADVNGSKGVPDNCPAKIPKFIITVGNFSITSSFDIDVKCRDENDNLLSSYDGSGQHLQLKAFGKIYGQSAWQNGQASLKPDDITSGWSSGEWSGTASIKELDNESFKLAITSVLFNDFDNYVWIEKIKLCPCALNDEDDTDDYITLKIHDYHSFDKGTANLDWYCYNDSTSTWEIISDSDEPVDDNGNALDLTSGWEDKGDHEEWSSKVDTTSFPSDYSVIRALPILESKECGLSNKHGAANEYVISGYSNTFFEPCSDCLDSSAIVWGGNFTYNPNEDHWDPTGIADSLQINGKELSNNNTYIEKVVDEWDGVTIVDFHWKMKVCCFSNDYDSRIWVGTKDTGDDPAGTYTASSEEDYCDTSISSLEVVEA